MMRLYILAAALLFSTGGMAVKSCGLTSWQIAGFRSAAAALTLLAILPGARRRPDRRTLLVGAAYAATLVLFALANKTTTAANAVFLQSTAPVYVLLLAPWLLGERVRARDAALLALMAAGLVMVAFGPEPATATAPAPALGNVLGAGAGLCWALTVIGLRWLGREDGAMAPPSAVGAVVTGNALAFFLTLPLALPVVESAPRDWLWILYLGVFQVALAYVLLTTGIRRVPALEASLLLLAEPVLSPLWAWWVHGETPGLWALAGGLLIVVVTAVKSWAAARLQSAPRSRARDFPPDQGAKS